MAQIDASIPLGVRPPQIENPANALARVLQVQGIQQQQDEYRRGIERKNRLQSLLGQEYAKPEERENALYRGGFLDEATKLAKERRENLKMDTEAESSKFEIAKKRLDLLGQTLGSVRTNPTLENATAAIQYLVSNGAMPPEKGQEAIMKFQANPTPEGIAAFAEMGFRAALSAKEQLPTFQTRNLGGTTDTLALDPVTQQVRTVNSAQNTQSPDSRASTAVQIRGQNLSDQRARERLDFERGNAVSDAGGPNQVALVKRFGKAPTGYRWRDDGTQEAIPGGPADIKAGELGAKRERQQQGAIAQADRVISKVDQALDKVGLNTAGFGSVLSKVPGTDARDLQTTLDTIKANLGFAELQAMRDASPTGGALGAIAVQELIALQSTVASLDQAQSPDELKKSLGQIKRHYEKWKETVSQGVKPKATSPDAEKPGQEPKRISSDAEYNALPSGAVFIGPDGKQRRKP